MSNPDMTAAILSLNSVDMVVMEPIPHTQLVLSAVGERCLSLGMSHEIEIWRAIPDEGVSVDALRAQFPDTYQSGFPVLMQRKAVEMTKTEAGPLVLRKGDCPEDLNLAVLQLVAAGKEPDAKDVAAGKPKRRAAPPATTDG